ncbi:M15 family metallopeptidase [Novosphingobium sp.]|jgi:peptidoglycan L-alanyl-D-glutamate endopeptidase CwlK|uniref:M15 family metallopeptidase n=1 Tax=Novosphingobium sp. TaxID=1874826 RepID=UPI002FE0FBF8
MLFILSARSLSRLQGVKPDLVRVVKRAIQITPIDFTVVEGLRTIERQREMVRTGKSKTMNSRHLTGHAVDLAPYIEGKVSWDWAHFYVLEKAIKQAAEEEDVELEWGGDWPNFPDGPHWQLSWKTYPA